MKENKKYICVCGKEFDNPQSFNGHKANCKEHYLAKYGNLEKYNEAAKARGKSYSDNCKIIRENKKNEELIQWISEQHTCKNCGKLMTEKYGSGIFCSIQCRTIYGNQHKKSVDIVCETCGRHFSSKQGYAMHKKFENNEITVSDSFKYSKAIRKSKNKNYKPMKNKVCPQCGKEFPKIEPGQHYDNGLGHDTKFCSIECKKIHTHNALSEKVKQSFKDGRNIGFISRDKLSFPEKFWIKVLDNNNIKYEHNYTVKHTPTDICKGSWFSLDFFIIKNDKLIDLEIDGKQHKYSERKIFDAERDSILTGLGYNIYRIPVDNYDSYILKEKVDNFLNWYNNL